MLPLSPPSAMLCRPRYVYDTSDYVPSARREDSDMRVFLFKLETKLMTMSEIRYQKLLMSITDCTLRATLACTRNRKCVMAVTSKSRCLQISYIYIYIYIYIFSIYIYICIYIYMCVCVFVCMCVCKCV